MIVSYDMAEKGNTYKVNHLAGCNVKATVAENGTTFFDAVQLSPTSLRVTGIGHVENGSHHPQDLAHIMSAVLEVANLADLAVAQVFSSEE